MIDDKVRWNEKYKTYPMDQNISKIVKKYVKKGDGLKALDIACGKGRNTTHIAECGYVVDGVDISDFALSCISEHKNINKQEIDLDSFIIEPNSYDLIVNINYLDRRLFPYIKAALKSGGVVIFETYLEVSDDKEYHQPSNRDFLLRSNELLGAFLGLRIIYYEEREDINIRDERVKIASLVAQKI